MPMYERSVEWCRKQMGAGHERFNDDQIRQIYSALNPIIHTLVLEAQKQWKQKHLHQK